MTHVFQYLGSKKIEWARYHLSRTFKEQTKDAFGLKLLEILRFKDIEYFLGLLWDFSITKFDLAFLPLPTCGS